MTTNLRPAECESDRRSVALRCRRQSVPFLRRGLCSELSPRSLEPTFLKKLAAERSPLDKGNIIHAPTAVTSTGSGQQADNEYMVDLRVLAPHFKAITEQMTELEAVCEENEVKINALENGRSALNSLLDTVRLELECTREEASDLEMNGDRLRRALELRDSQLADSRLRERESRLLFAQQSDDASEEQKLLAVASGRLADVSTECEDLRNERDNLLLEKETSTRELQLLREKLTKTHKLQQKNRALLGERDEVRKQMCDLESNNKYLIEQLQQADDGIDALEEELGSLRTAARQISTEELCKASDFAKARKDSVFLHLDTQLAVRAQLSSSSLRVDEEFEFEKAQLSEVREDYVQEDYVRLQRMYEGIAAENQLLLSEKQTLEEQLCKEQANCSETLHLVESLEHYIEDMEEENDEVKEEDAVEQVFDAALVFAEDVCVDKPSFGESDRTPPPAPRSTVDFFRNIGGMLVASLMKGATGDVVWAKLNDSQLHSRRAEE